MGFANVDGQKIDVVLVIFVELNDIANLATERRSSKTAKDQDQWPTGRFLADVETRGAVQGDEPRVRGLIADL
jgi:hypothetical protein